MNYETARYRAETRANITGETQLVIQFGQGKYNFVALSSSQYIDEHHVVRETVEPDIDLEELTHLIERMEQ